MQHKWKTIATTLSSFLLETNITFSKYVFQKCFSYFENNSPPKWVSKNDFSIDVIACFTTLLPSKNIFFYIFNINFSIIIIRSLFQNFNAKKRKNIYQNSLEISNRPYFIEMQFDGLDKNFYPL